MDNPKAGAMSSNDCQAKVDCIPVVDLSRSAEEVCLQTVREACEEWGCFRVINHGIEAVLMQSADMVCRDAFKLSTQTKMKNVSPNPLAGYFGGIGHSPFYESLGIAGVPNADAIQGFCDVMWPQGNQEFCKVMQEYTSKMMEVSKRIQQIILESLGVSKYYTSHFNHGKAMVRINMYDTSSELSPECIGLVPHTDVFSITVVQVDESGGIQVLNKEGEWVDVKATPDSFVVFAGDGYQAWSNGRIRNVKHRVVVKRQQFRVSLAFFSMIPEEMEIKAPAELVDEENPQRYRAFRFGDLIDYRLNEGKGKEDALKLFAGICV